MVKRNLTKRTNDDLQNTEKKTKDRATRTPLESINKQMDYLARSFQYESFESVLRWTSISNNNYSKPMIYMFIIFKICLVPEVRNSLKMT